MSNQEIIKAWKDAEYRQSLLAEQQVQLPENPAGLAELSESVAQNYIGGGSIPEKPEYKFTEGKACVAVSVTNGFLCSEHVTGGFGCLTISKK